jgi:hypothetical protein
LPERSAESLCAWLKDHPEADIISRDRGHYMILGATAGAPMPRRSPIAGTYYGT